MNLTQILAFLTPLAGVIEPILLNLEQGTIKPELDLLVNSVTSPDLKLLLAALATGLDAFATAEIKKLV